MGIVDIFSKRTKRASGPTDVFSYDSVPPHLRVQIVQIWHKAFGPDTGGDRYSRNNADDAYDYLHNTLAHEYGMFVLAPMGSTQERLVNFFLKTPDAEKALDVIELSFRYIDKAVRLAEYGWNASPTMSADEAIKELNARLLEHGIGYQYHDEKLIRKDSEVLHSQVVTPVLLLLHDKRYAGAQQEFLKAHEHYRHGNYKECLNECLKAFESTLKSICDIRKWKYKPTDTAKNLLEIAFDKALVPDFLQSHYSSLRNSLESGIPTVRNKLGGHGQGPQPVQLPPHYPAYMLHLTATTILFLIDAEKAMS